jgi:N-acetylmuramic acid 6-phosphate etherase
MTLPTEQDSPYDHLEKMEVRTILESIHAEDSTVTHAVSRAIPQVNALVEAILPRMESGGRLFYLGAGTSGRLGIVDASECPPTFGIPHDVVIGLIAGGDVAIRKAVEHAEDNPQAAWQDMSPYKPIALDAVVGIAASGKTPYVLGGIQDARQHGLLTGCITCNPDTTLATLCEYPVEVVTGAEFVTGSTRMKAGTAQKMVLNMLSTALMIKLGRVKGNKMVDMKLSNAKLIERGNRMLCQLLGIHKETAALLLKTHGSVRKAMEVYLQQHA